MDQSQTEQDSSEHLSRRRFVALAAAGCAAMCACGSVGVAATTQSSKPIDVGTLADYGKDGVSDKFLKSHSIFVTRDEGKVFASTSICPHRSAQLRIRNGGIYCPKHGSEFTADGEVTKGPADSSLERYAISKDDAGHLMVDKSKSFREKNWTDAASFVKVDA